MNLNQLAKTTQKSKKRIGRGPGSGRGGHTVGHGQKGQKSRGKIFLLFEGSKLRKTLIKRLPLLRGKGKFKSRQPSKLIVNLKYLNLFKKDEVVNINSLAEKGIIKLEDGKKLGVKILGEGRLLVPLTIQLPVSGGAKKKIEEAGGKVIPEGASEGLEKKKITKKRQNKLPRSKLAR